jgi:gluconolactonase
MSPASLSTSVAGGMPTIQPDHVDVVAAGLRFPEGPVVLADGSVLVVEMFGERLVRVASDGSVETVAEVPGGPNGAALGPDGLVYVCNNGGSHTEVLVDGVPFPGPPDPRVYRGGSIDVVDLASGAVRTLYTHCGDRALASPNDIVFDGHGGFYFTDLGMVMGDRGFLGGVYYATVDGLHVETIAFPVHAANGIGLSPGGEVLVWAESFNGRLTRRRLRRPGAVETPAPLDPWPHLYGFGGYVLLDSLAFEASGNVCVATCFTGGIATISPEGELLEHIEIDDYATTNIAFGGECSSVAYITASGTGRLLRIAWPRPGLPLNGPVSPPAGRGAGRAHRPTPCTRTAPSSHRGIRR